MEAAAKQVRTTRLPWLIACDSNMRPALTCHTNCAIAWKGYKAGKGSGKKDRVGQDLFIVEKELMNER